jgi:hypothetical protein
MATHVEQIREMLTHNVALTNVSVKMLFKLPSFEAADALLLEAQKPAPLVEQLAPAPVVEEKFVPEWETPAHEEIDLATVEISELGLDPFSSDPLVDRIIEAHEHPALSRVPAQLKQKPNWVRWKLEEVNGRLTKIPYQNLYLK